MIFSFVEEASVSGLVNLLSFYFRTSLTNPWLDEKPVSPLQWTQKRGSRGGIR